MSSRPLGLTAEELLRQDLWLRNLVRSLVGESEVDDVVQETWASALRRGAPVERPRAWLSVVAGNFARRARRSVGRRSHREELAARPEAVPSTAETLELLDLHEHVVRAVRELREPYRTSVLLRYTHGLTVREIAARTGVSEAAVRQRLKRGLDALRAEVGVRCGDDWRDMPALAAWLIPGALEMKKTTWIAAAALAVTSVGALAVWVGWPGESPGGAADTSVELIAAADVEPERPALELAQPGAEARTPVASSDTLAPAPVTAITYSGRVLDARGKPLGGIGLAPTSSAVRSIPSTGFERPAVVTSTERDGTFRFTMDAELGQLLTGPGWVPIGVPSFGSETQKALLIAAPAVEMGGTVLDSEEVPLAGVAVRVVGVDLRDFNAVLAGVQRFEWLASATDEAGRFRHRDLPGGVGRLRFEKDGYRARELDVGAFDARDLTVVLEADEVVFVVSGWVLAPNGAPVEGALVGLGERTTRALADGAFELRIAGEQAPTRRDDLWAAMPPWRTEIVERVGAALLDEEDKALEYELVFDGEALAIGGRIVDVDGAPAEGVSVYIWRQRELLPGRSPEELAVPEDREVLHVGPGLRVWSKTDAEGRFRIDGLRDMEYRLRLFDRERFAAWTSEPIQAGAEGVELMLPGDFLRPEVTGRVIDRAGAGVAGVTLSPQVWTFLTEHAFTWSGSGREFLTGDDGRFTLTDVSGGDLLLSVYGASIIVQNHFLRESDAVTGIEIVVDYLCNFRLVLTGEREIASGFKVLDAAGEPLNVAAFGGGEFGWSTWRSLEGGRTRVLSVGQSAATLVLYDNVLSEIDRLPLALHQGDVNEIDW